MKQNEKLQYRWSSSNSKGIRLGAINRVDEIFNIRKSLKWKFPMNSVLIIGAQWGHEANRYREQGVKKIVCLDMVKRFIDMCKERGFKTVNTSIEKWKPTEFDGVHASHVLEHCYDREKAVENVKAAAQYWCYISVPIEPEGTKDPAHLSPVKDKIDIIREFKPWEVIETENSKTTFTGLFLNNEYL